MPCNLTSEIILADSSEFARCEVADAYHWFSGPEIRELARSAQRIVMARAHPMVRTPPPPPTVTDHCVYLD
jgi:hypothetical protein